MVIKVLIRCDQEGVEGGRDEQNEKQKPDETISCYKQRSIFESPYVFVGWVDPEKSKDILHYSVKRESMHNFELKSFFEHLFIDRPRVDWFPVIEERAQILRLHVAYGVMVLICLIRPDSLNLFKFLLYFLAVAFVV